jgi:hypothetical protein
MKPRLDPAFKDDSNVVVIDCSDIKKKSSSRTSDFKETGDEDVIRFSLVEELEKIEKAEREFIATRSMESGRTLEWVEISLEHKRDHYRCEYCGKRSDLHVHDILPYRHLTEDQTHDRDFLKQNLIMLCKDHHYGVAHLGDPYCLKFDPKIRDTCEQHSRPWRLKEERENQERYAKMSMAV